MQVAQALKQLEHITLYLRFCKVNVWVGRHAGEIVIHVRSDHVHGGSLLAIFCRAVSQVRDMADGGEERIDVLLFRSTAISSKCRMLTWDSILSSLISRRAVMGNPSFSL